ncbi:MAG: ribosome biogenesis GTP-binding protein YihA/YsxC [Bacteroidota bacterium]
MEIKKAEFLLSNTAVAACPEPDRPEYAFIGRSNVGKSSLINMLTSRKKLAKTSSTPGKTQLINHFMINDDWYLVDLPGYGWAQTSKSNKAQWRKMIEDYLLKRTNLVLVFLLIDVRHPPQEVDTNFMTWMGEKQIPFVLVFTKADKLGKNALGKNIEQYKQELLKTWEELPLTFATSSTSGLGQKEMLNYIDKVNLSLIS